METDALCGCTDTSGYSDFGGLGFSAPKPSVFGVLCRQMLINAFLTFSRATEPRLLCACISAASAALGWPGVALACSTAASMLARAALSFSMLLQKVCTCACSSAAAVLLDKLLDHRVVLSLSLFQCVRKSMTLQMLQHAVSLPYRVRQHHNKPGGTPFHRVPCTHTSSSATRGLQTTCTAQSKPSWACRACIALGCRLLPSCLLLLLLPQLLSTAPGHSSSSSSSSSSAPTGTPNSLPASSSS